MGLSSGNVIRQVAPAIMVFFFGWGNYLSSEDSGGVPLPKKSWIELLYSSEAVGRTSQMLKFSG